MAETHKIRTTINPDVEIEVSDREYTDLKRQGLLHEQDADGPAETNSDEVPARQPYHSRRKDTKAAEGVADEKKED